jgi:DNA (cytosine-5)-methyltransferase 1
LIARCLNAHPNRIDGESETFVAHSLRAEGFDAGEDGTGRGTPLVAFAQNQRDEVRCMDVAGALAAEPGAKQQTYAWSIMPQNSGRDYKAREVDVAQPVMGSGPVGGNQGGDYIQTYTLHGADKTVSTATETDIAGSIRTKPPGGIENSSTTVALQLFAVRRLTPRECERLQGFPDGWTDVVYRGKPAADGPRYQALGNAFAIPVVRWIARRLVAEDAASAQPGVLAA